MDVVVRTPHGDADIDIVAAPTDATLAELVRAVTGQAAPATTRVDGRVVSTTRLLSDLDLVIGSLIDTRPERTGERSAEPDAFAVGLVQLSGRGAGTSLRLPIGRYRIGSARRLHADELDRAQVDTPAFDLDVGPRGVRVTPGPDIGGALGVYTPTLGSELFDRELPWTGERLDVGGRLFDLEIPPRDTSRRRLPAPDHDGSIPFQRTPGGSAQRRRVVIDAADEAAAWGVGLWARRRDDAGAFDAAFGFHADGATIASVDLQRHRGVALVGSERFTTALARTMLVELATLHGPADLDIVVASTPEHIAQWNWAKWLPHVRRAGPASAAELFDDSNEMANWAAALSATGAPVAGSKPVTLLVLDDISLWSRRDSPVRSLLIDPPPELRIMALCVGLHEAPGMCTSLIEEVQPLDRLAHLTSVTRSSGTGRPALFGSLATQHTRLADAPSVVTDIHPALTQITLAATVARHLAPLDDLEARHHSSALRPRNAPTLAELVELAASASRATASPTGPPGGRLVDRSSASLDVPIGVSLDTARADAGVDVGVGASGDHGDDPSSRRTAVTVDLAAPLSTIVVSGDETRHDHTVAALVLGAATQRSPDEMVILVVSRDLPVWHSELPHFAGWAGRDEADDPGRLVHRVAHVLTEQPDLHVLVVIERAFDATDPMPIELVDAMTELAESLQNVHVVLTGDHPDSIPGVNRARCGALAWIGDGGVGRLWIGDRQLGFDGVAGHLAGDEPNGPAALDAAELIIRPTTHGRAMTPLERRLTRSILAATATTTATATDGDALLTAVVARQVSTRTVGEVGRSTPSLLPPPLPSTIDFASLLEQHPGDGVPLGLVDRPERAENEAYWWQPGSGGSILAVGSPRSGMTSLLDLVICGTAARMSADDLHVYAIEALPQRRRAIEALPHTGGVVSPDRPEAVRRLVRGLHVVHTERLDTRADTDRPHLVLLIGDVSRMVRSLPAESVDVTLQQLAEIAVTGPSVGMNVIAITTHVGDLGPLAQLTGDRLVGATSDPADRTRMGAPMVGAADRHPGRCWSVAADRRVQLARPAARLDAEIERLSPEPAQQRRPAMIVPGAGS